MDNGDQLDVETPNLDGDARFPAGEVCLFSPVRGSSIDRSKAAIDVNIVIERGTDAIKAVIDRLLANYRAQSQAWKATVVRNLVMPAAKMAA